MTRPRGTVWAGDGGCWFCWHDDGELLFDTEFDTYVHEQCIRDVLAADPDHPEAQCMRYLLLGGQP